MTIAAIRVNEIAFYDIYNLLESFSWLKHYNPALLELWNLCDDREQQILIKELFNRFKYVDGHELEKLSKAIVSKINNWNINPSQAYLGAVADEGEVDGSIAGLQHLKNKFEDDSWKESNFCSSITKIAYEAKNNYDLILFDDFIGSGKTIIRKVNYLSEKLKERGINIKSLRVVAYAGMEFGIDQIKSSLNIDVFCAANLKKGITDYESHDAVEEKKQLMRNLESKLAVKNKRLRLKDHSLGYRESETLFQIQGQNCPNNLFPVFWWPELVDKSPRKTLFKRLR